MIPPLSKCYYESWLQQLHKAPNTVSETLQMLRKRNFLLKITFCSHFSRSIDNTDFYLVNWACDLKKKKFQYSFIQPFPSLPCFFFPFDFSFLMFCKCQEMWVEWIKVHGNSASFVGKTLLMKLLQTTWLAGVTNGGRRWRMGKRKRQMYWFLWSVFNIIFSIPS